MNGRSIFMIAVEPGWRLRPAVGVGEKADGVGDARVSFSPLLDPDFSQALRRTARRHDLIAVRLSDPRDLRTRKHLLTDRGRPVDGAGVCQQPTGLTTEPINRHRSAGSSRGK